MILRRKKSIWMISAVILAGTISLMVKVHYDFQLLPDSPYFYLTPAFGLTVLFFTLYFRLKPLASINGSSLTIDGQTFNKEVIEYMKYKVESREFHQLIIKMKGFEEHMVPLNNSYGDFDNNYLFDFICNNYYPLTIVTS